MDKARKLALNLSKNLAFFMGNSKLYPNANALAKAAGVDPKTVRALLAPTDPKKRTRTSAKAVGYPAIDTIAKIAEKLSCEVWELLHPDIQLARHQAEFYALANRNFGYPPQAATALHG